MKNTFLVVNGVAVGATMPELFVSTAELDAWFAELKKAMDFYDIPDLTPDIPIHAPSPFQFLCANVSIEFAERFKEHRERLRKLEAEEPDAIRRRVMISMSARWGISPLQSMQIFDLFDETFDLSIVFYKVQAGDTLSAIAEKFGVTQGAIVDENKIENPDSIRAGDTLRIPNGKATPHFTVIG